MRQKLVSWNIFGCCSIKSAGIRKRLKTCLLSPALSSNRRREKLAGLFGLRTFLFQGLEGGAGGLAFGRFFAFAHAAAQLCIPMQNNALKGAVMIGAGDGTHLVLRRLGGLGLEQFLKLALRIVQAGYLIELAKGGSEGAEDKFAHCFETSIEEDGSQQSFESVPESGSAVASTAGLFAAAEDEKV